VQGVGVAVEVNQNCTPGSGENAGGGGRRTHPTRDVARAESEDPPELRLHRQEPAEILFFGGILPLKPSLRDDEHNWKVTNSGLALGFYPACPRLDPSE
jgi:hypothetical protein